MDKRKSIINICVSISFKIVILVVTLLVRRFLIKYIGNEINGLNSLYLSIVGFLSVAELGVGSAITFCMYKPIIENDVEKVAGLYCLFKKLYLMIGIVILIAGLALMPFLPYFAKDYLEINVNLYLTFGLMLISIVLSYCFSAKSSLITAYKDNYIVTTITSLGTIMQCILQIVVLIFTKSYVWYLVCRIIAILFQWILTEIYARKDHSDIINLHVKIDPNTKKYVTRSIKAMFMHKIGDILVNTADSVIISIFIGVVLLGKYSNYVTIVSSMMGLITLFFTPLTAIIGHMSANGDVEAEKKYCNFFHTFNFIIGCIFFLGYYAVIDDVVAICFDKNLELGRDVVIVITINYFIQFMRQSINLFRDATGTFYYDRYKPLIEGAINIILSVIFVNIFGIVGVIVATIITNIFICHIVEPYVLYVHAFDDNPKKYYLRNYAYIFLFLITLFVFTFIRIDFDNVWISFIVNGVLSVMIAIFPCIVAFIFSKDFRFYFNKILLKFKSKFFKRNVIDN